MYSFFIIVFIVSISSLAAQNVALFHHYANFSRVARTLAFVDKSLLIKRLFEGPKNKMILAPPRFGKTTNLQMVKTFLSIPVNETGARINPNVTEAHAIFKALNIYKEQPFFYNHFGVHPVIYLDFRCDHIIVNYIEVYGVIRNTIHRSFREHSYICKSKKLNKEERKMCKIWCHIKGHITMDPGDVDEGLFLLSDYLYRYYDNTTLIVLVDEYDSIIRKAVLEVNELVLYDTIDTIKGRLALLLLANERVQWSLVSGTSFVHLKEIYITTYKFLENHQFVDFYGFTVMETEHLLRTIFHFKPKKIKKICEWYNGYTSKNGKMIYSPLSLLNYLQKSIFRCYWKDCDSLELFKESVKVPSIREDISRLVENKSLSLPFINYYTLFQLMDLQVIFLNKTVTSRKDVLYSYLFENGYFTYDIKNNCYIKIPNEEIKKFIKSKIL